MTEQQKVERANQLVEELKAARIERKRRQERNKWVAMGSIGFFVAAMFTWAHYAVGIV